MKLLLFIFFLTATSAFCQTNGWRPLNGPYDGTFSQVVFDKDSDIAAVAMDGGLYGRSSGVWNKLTSPSIAGSGLYIGVELDDQGNLFYYNNYPGAIDNPGIYKSTDFGTSWVSTFSTASIQKIVSVKSGNLYAFQGGPFNSGNTVIYRSTNHGDNWNKITSIPLSSVEFSVDHNEQCYFSTDATTLEVIQYDPITDHYYNYTSAFATTGKVYLCQLHDTLIAKTTDAIYYLNSAKIWKKQGDFLSPKVESYPWRSNVPIFASEAMDRLYATGLVGKGYEIFSSVDLGKTWQQFLTKTPEMDYGYNFLAVDDNGAVYDVGISNSIGIWKSDDLGANWRQIGKSYDIHYSFQEGPKKSLFVSGLNSTQYRPYISFSNGNSWDNLSSYVPTTDINEYGAFAKDFNDGFIFLSSFNGVMYCSPPFFNAFEIQNSSFWISSLVTASTASKKNCFVQLDIGNAPQIYPLYKSSDHGISWEQVEYPITGSFRNAINTDANGVLYIGSFPSLYRSSDEGATWTKIETGIKNAGISVIRFDGERILLGTLGSGIWHSRDNGSTWSQWLSVPTDSVLALERYGDKYYCATSIGLYSCPVEGSNWSPVLFANEQIRIHQLLKTSDEKLYASVKDRGLWAFDESVRSVPEKTIHSTVLRIVSQTSQTITVAFDASGDQGELSLYNILGNRVWNTSTVNDAQSAVIPITSLPIGMYYITFHSSNGSAFAKVFIHQ